MQAPTNSQTCVSEIAINNPDPCVPMPGSFPDFEVAFLAPIDKAVRIPLMDRMQSAQEWVNLIAPQSKHVKNYVRPVVNESFSMTLTSLVSEANRDLLTIPPTQMKVTPLQAHQANTSNNVAD